jgi:hypothetical protein
MTTTTLDPALLLPARLGDLALPNRLAMAPTPTAARSRTAPASNA